jgi:hypothetical protein
MTLLPIVGRELRVAARRWSVYWGRVATAGIAVLVFAWVIAFVMPGMAVPFAHSGNWIFRNLVVMAAIYGAIGGVVATADSLSRERREGALGLLFLTDLRGYDVVLGKLAAVGVRSLYSMLAIIPVLAVAMAMGGVTYNQVALAVVAVGNLVFFSAALGIRVSVVSRSERKALFAGLVLLAIAVVAPWIAAGVVTSFLMGPKLVVGPSWVVVVLSPIYPVGQLLMGTTPRVTTVSSGYFWLSVGLVQAMSWGVLVAASGLAARVWQAPQALRGWAHIQHAWDHWVYGRGHSRIGLRRRLLGRNPFLWVLQRERWKGWYAWGYLAVVLTFWLIGNRGGDEILYEEGVALPAFLLIHGFLKVWVISECVSRLVEDRRAGAMELLLTTPLSDAGVVQGYWLGLRRLFLGPTLALAGFEFLVLGKVLGYGYGFFAVLVLVADMLGVAGAAMWHGLVSRGANRALLRVIALILVLPWGLVGMWMAVAASSQRQLGAWAEPTFLHGFVAWCIASLLVDGLSGYRYADLVRRHFRRIVSEGRARSVFGLKSVT